MPPAVSQLLLPALLLAPAVAPASARPIIPGYERFYSAGKGDLAAGGRLLLGELGCASCHQADGARRRQAPILDHVGARARAGHLRQFLADPRKTKPGTLMPDLLRDDPRKAEEVEALVHLLASRGAIRHARPSPKMLTRGRDLHEKVGCVACHGSRNALGKPEQVLSGSVPMGDLETKYSLPGLAGFLADPLHARPSGRMPRLLTAEEAKAVAGYLLQGLSPPLVGKGTAAFSYYEGRFEKLPDFAKLKPKATGVVGGFDIGVAARESSYALRFSAVLPVERAGEYTFALLSDDGSRLWVDGKLVVDNDGEHAPKGESGKAHLTKGIHEVVVGFFQSGGGAELNVSVTPPGQSEVNLGELVASSAESLNAKKPADKKDDDSFDPRPELVAEGKQLFASLGCASCHQLKLDGKAIEPTLKAQPLAKLTADKGCLAVTPARGVPHFGLDEPQRKAVAAALATKPPPPTPATVIAETMTAFNCYACHSRDKAGGPVEELNKAFLTAQPEMGDEGRLPPPLDGVGAKLAADYFKNLLEKGAHDRPYMHTRMPGFGLANTGAVVEAFAAVDRVLAAAKVEFADPPAKVKAQARHLIGGLALGCIKCHTFNGVKAEGVQGIDLTLMPGRLKRDWFHAYVADPQQIRPGTRMPASFLKGKSVLPDVLDGTAATQIEAMWLYLQDGRKARLPAGMGPVSIPLVPFEGAILHRGFIEGVGTRAIAVGYPEKAHLAFDANEVRLALLWQGAFLDAGRHWSDRGAGFEGPLGDNLLKLPLGAAFAVLPKEDTPWPAEPPRKLGYRFDGYRLTADDRPTFRYSFAGVAVEDFPNPAASGKEVTLKRTITLSATKPIEKLHYRAAIGTKIEPAGHGWYRIDGSWRVKVPAGARVRKAAGKAELLVPVRFAGSKARLEQEYLW
jgi:mono/diheme cytochrome c family protein